jgi:hypothetical protein
MLKLAEYSEFGENDYWKVIRLSPDRCEVGYSDGLYAYCLVEATGNT